MRQNRGAVKISGGFVSALIATVCTVGVLVAFVGGASPYVTLREAKASSGDALHLKGDLLKESVATDISKGLLRFQMRDANGELVHVVHDGQPPANMGEATQIVAIGRMSGDSFRSHKLLVKCPSKYEGVKGGSSTATRS